MFSKKEKYQCFLMEKTFEVNDNTVFHFYLVISAINNVKTPPKGTTNVKTYKHTHFKL